MPGFLVLLQLILLPDSPLPAVSEQNPDGSLFIVHFSTGPAWDHDKPPADQKSLAEHSSNLGRLRSEGTILLGGRYDDLGLIILQSSSIESATELLTSDPGVQEGIFRFTVSPIYLFYEWKNQHSSDADNGGNQ